jgi:hypothetical protein
MVAIFRRHGLRCQGSGQAILIPDHQLCLLTLQASTTTPSQFAFPQFPSTSFHHAGAPHEPTKLHDPRNLHGTQGYTNIPHTLFPQTLYNNPHSPNPASQTHYYRPPPNAIPPATQGVPSPSNHRKRKNNTTGRGGARKRQWQPAPIVTAPTSAKLS